MSDRCEVGRVRLELNDSGVRSWFDVRLPTTLCALGVNVKQIPASFAGLGLDRPPARAGIVDFTPSLLRSKVYLTGMLPRRRSRTIVPVCLISPDLTADTSTDSPEVWFPFSAALVSRVVLRTARWPSAIERRCRRSVGHSGVSIGAIGPPLIREPADEG